MNNDLEKSVSNIKKLKTEDKSVVDKLLQHFREAREKGSTEIFTTDVTYSQLASFKNHKYLNEILSFLRTFWVGEEDQERETDTRIGSVNINFSAEGNLEINFATRFSLNENQQEEIKEIIKKTKQQEYREFKSQLEIIKK